MEAYGRGGSRACFPGEAGTALKGSMVTHSQGIDAGVLRSTAEHLAQPLVLEHPEQLRQDSPQSRRHGGHHLPHGQGSAAEPERSVSRAASATAPGPGQLLRTQAVLQPWPCPAPTWSARGPCLGRRMGLRWRSPWGREERGGGTLAAEGLADPPGLRSMVGWRALLLRDVLQFPVGLAARESLPPTLSPQETSPLGCRG